MNRWLLILPLLVGCADPLVDQTVTVQTEAPQRPATKSYSTPQLPPVRHLLKDGDGNDWVSLSDREKLRLCNIIAETVGQHDAWHYREFLGTFYQDEDMLGRDIAEVAAVAAASK